MRDKEINQRNQRGTANGLWVYRWANGNISNINNYIDGRVFGYNAHYGVKEELITSFYYAR